MLVEAAAGAVGAGAGGVFVCSAASGAAEPKDIGRAGAGSGGGDDCCGLVKDIIQE